MKSVLGNDKNVEDFVRLRGENTLSIGEQRPVENLVIQREKGRFPKLGQPPTKVFFNHGCRHLLTLSENEDMQIKDD